MSEITLSLVRATGIDSRGVEHSFAGADKTKLTASLQLQDQVSTTIKHFAPEGLDMSKIEQAEITVPEGFFKAKKSYARD